jgi:hypothetical protein
MKSDKVKLITTLVEEGDTEFIDGRISDCWSRTKLESQVLMLLQRLGVVRILLKCNRRNNMVFLGATGSLRNNLHVVLKQGIC